MTVWATPVPHYLAGQTYRESGLGRTQRTTGAEPGTDDVLSREGARAPARRNSLGSIPTAAEVEAKQDQWLEFAPTSPQRRNSFVSEPSAVAGNPFEIFKGPDSNNDALLPNTFYSAGAAYQVNERPVVIEEEADDIFGKTSALPVQGMMEPMAPGPVGVVPSFPESQPMRPTALPGAAATYRNPFGEPLSPIRYNKPAPKVVLSPGSAERLNFIFSDLDPFKRAPSPRSQMPLHIMQRDPSVGVPLSQVPARHSPQHFAQPQPQPVAANGWPQPQAAWPQFGAQHPTHQQGPTAPSFQGFPLQPWAPKSPTRQAADSFGFGFDAVPPGHMSPFKSGSSAGGVDDGFGTAADAFDPIKQKSLVESSFDLSVGNFFTEEEVKAGGVQYDDDEEDGPEDDPDDDGSVGDGEDGFELQDDQFAEEGVGGGYLYEVSFTSPQQLGMLLERKDEWTRGHVQRRERTVVTLVVEAGEAEQKGVTVGSMIMSINGESVIGKTYKETLDMVKLPARPMRIVFEKESPKDEVIQGYFFVSKGPFFSLPTTMDKWKRKYVVLGGPIAKKNVLQVRADQPVHSVEHGGLRARVIK
jgi:hypothetical protein